MRAFIGALPDGKAVEQLAAAEAVAVGTTTPDWVGPFLPRECWQKIWRLEGSIWRTSINYAGRWAYGDSTRSSISITIVIRIIIMTIGPI